MGKDNKAEQTIRQVQNDRDFAELTKKQKPLIDAYEQLEWVLRKSMARWLAQDTTMETPNLIIDDMEALIMKYALPDDDLPDFAKVRKEQNANARK